MWRQWRYLHAKKCDTGTKQRQVSDVVKETKALCRPRETEETSHFELHLLRATQGVAEYHYQELLRLSKSPMYENTSE